MMKICTFLLMVNAAIGSTAAVAYSDTKSVVRMVILGTSSGNGGFVTTAVSVSAGVGTAVIGGYVVDPQSGSIGTAVATGAAESDISSSLGGFTKSYETSVCLAGTCPDNVVN